MRRVGAETEIIPVKLIGETEFPAPFASGLEYSVPARGGWTIVHVGMLVPEAHEIFVCAAGCLRGVVLSAAEMNLTSRFSTVAIEEHNVLEGDMEDLFVEGVTDILRRLPKLPKAVLVYSSCIHHFVGSDLEMCFRILRERFPEVDFADCYMIPTMRKSGLTPDQIMRRQLYSLLKPVPKLARHCAIVGNCFSIEESSDLVKLISRAGWTLHQITDCKNYEEYQQMAQCELFISTQAVAKVGGEALAGKLGMPHLYLPVTYEPERIRGELELLAKTLGMSSTDGVAEQLIIETEARAEAEIIKVQTLIKDTPIVIDYTFTPHFLELAKYLIQHKFNVVRIYLDSFNGEEKAAYCWLKENAPKLEVMPTVDAGMRRIPSGSEGKVLALGQKAAYFTDSPYFVNLVENGGLYGFEGIRHLAELMKEALQKPKDVERTISIKGLGCESCL